MKTFEEKRKEADSNFVSFEQKRSASSANNMADRLATFGRNAEEFYKEANKYGDFENAYEGNQSGAWYSNLSEWNNNFRREADSIKRNLGGYDTATAKRIADSLDKTLSQQNELLQRAGNIDSAWKEIGDEEGWQKWKADVANTRFLESFDYKKNKDIIDQMSKSGYQYEPVAFGKRIYTDPDQLTSSLEDKYGKDYVQAVFEHYGITDGDSARKAQTTLEQDRVNSDYMKLGRKYEDEIAAVNPTPATELDISELPNAFKIANDATFRNAFLALDDTEKGFVKYLASTGRGDEIETFIYSLEQQKNNELANRVTSLITGIDNDFGRYLAELGMSVASGLSQAGEGIEGLGNLISGNDKYTATNALQNAGAQLVEYEASKYSWGKFHPAAVLLSATQTTANMLPSILVGTMLGGGAIVMGAGAAGNAYNEAINSGMNPSSAALYSGMIGASETGLQYLLGGISSLGKGAGGAFEPLTEYMLGKVDNAIGRAAISLVGNGLSEATEEGLQEILEPWFKYITTGVKWDNANIDDVLYSSLLGFLSAGMLEGVPNLALTAVNEVNVAKIGNAIKENGMLGDVVEYVNTLPEEQRTKLAQNLTEDASGYKVGQTIRELGAGLSAQNVQTISGYLFELGLPQKEANTIAEGMAAVVNGEEASPELVSALDNPLVMSAWQSLFLQGERTTGQTVQTKDDFVNAVYRAVGVAKPITEKVDTTLGDRVRSNINAYEDIMRRTSSVNAVRNAAKAKDIADNIETTDIETTEQTPIESVKSADEYVGRAIDGLGFDTLSAQVLKDGINGTGINPITYAEGVREAALIGLNGIKDDSAQAMMDNSSFAPLLPANIRDMAYRIGRAKYDASVEKADSTVREAVRQAGSKETPKAESKVTYDRSIDRKALNGSQKAQIAGVVQVSKAIGVDVEFYDSSKYGRKTEKGMSNGFFTGNKLYLDINAGTQQTILYTAAHELTHFVKQWSPAKFETLKDFLFDFLTSEGYNAESFIKIEMEKAKAAGVKYSLADAVEDTVCEAMQMMLSSDNAIEKIAELSAKDKGLVDRIRKQLKKIIARITNALKGIDPTSESAKILQESYDAMQKLNTLFCEALVDAGENYSAVASAYGKDAVVEVNDDGEVLIVHGRTGTDAPIEHNLKTWKEGGRDRLAEYLSVNGYSQNDIRRTLSVMDFYANAVYEYGNQYGLQKQINEMSVATDIKGEKTILSALIQNGDYPVNIDLTTICKKRQAMQKIVDRLCETGLIKSTVLNPETINQINKILGENALETACLGCFVESRRVNVQRWANEICNEWNKIVSGYNKKAPFFGFGDTTVRDMSDGDITKLTNELDKAHEEIGVNEEGVLKMGTGSVTRMETLLKNVPELRKFMRPGDLLTSEGRVNIKALPGGAELNSIIVGRYGSNTPKVVQGYNPYTNELLDYNKRDFVQYLFDIGGARAQSFSDFMVENWFDYMQIVADAYARQIPMHMYTKESALVELFGMTGIKINMSLIPDIDPTVDKDHAGLTKVNGKWQMIWADKDRFKATGGKSYMQSFNYRDAVRLQNDPRYSKNIGTITIGISDAQIRMALGDNNIRMVIPYHLSGMNPLFARLAGVSNYNDYTPFQNNNIIAIYDENGNKVDLKLTNSQKQNLKGGYEWNAKLQEIGDARATAQDYIAWCRDRNNHTVKIGGKTYYAEIAPKFSGWDNNGKYTEAKDFTNEKNYYKLLEDFNSYYFENGKEIAAPQGAVQMNFPDNFQKVLEEYLSNRQASMNKMGGRLDKAYRQIESYIKDEDFSRREKMLDMLDAKGRAELLKGRGRAMSIDEQVLEQNLLEKQFGLEQTELTKEKTRDLYSPERVNADGEGGVKHSLKVTDEKTIERLDNDEHITTYKSLVQIDGKLYSPMATKTDGKLGNPYEIGQWYEAVENPDFDKLYIKEGKNYIIASKRGINESNADGVPLFYKLVKENSTSPVYARYNPYEHSSNSVFNDQFSSAYKRPNLVTVEVEVPASEQGAYKARYAKDGTGWTEWKSGNVSRELAKVGRRRDLFLSRWAKIKRVIPDAEVAHMMAKELKGTDIVVNEQVVTPSLYEELQKAGVKIEGIKFSLKDEEYMTAVEKGDTKKAEKLVREAATEAGYTSPKLYHGTNAFGFTSIDTRRSNDRISFFATSSEKTAGTYSRTNAVRNVGIPANSTSSLGIYQLYANTDNMLEFDANGAESNHIALGRSERDYNVISTTKSWYTHATAKQVAKYAKRSGYDGVIIRNVIDTATPESRNADAVSDVYVFFNPATQVKSADPITYDNDGNVIPLSERFNSENSDIRYSLKDSNGNQLTPAQAEFFKDSKVRDENGNLRVVYHGTRSEMFNTFAKTDYIGYFFTDDESVAGTYSKTWSRDAVYAPPSIKTWQDLKRVAEDLDVGVVKTDNGYIIEWAYPGDVEYSENELDQAARDMFDEYEQHYGNNRNYEVYLNITDPLVINGDGSNWNEVYDYYDGLKTYDELTEAEKEAIADNLDMDVDEFEEEWQSETARRFDTVDMHPIYPQSTRDWVMEAADGGYDGVIFKDIIDTAGDEAGFRPSDVYVALNSNQIKSVNNADPTTNEDIRYQFKGENAQLRDDNLDVAKKMASEGVDNEKIRLATGWFKGMDGKWRYEINDNGATLNLERAIRRKKDEYGERLESLTETDSRKKFVRDTYYSLAHESPATISSIELKYLLDHPDLYAEYPWLEGKTVSFAKPIDNALGWVDEKQSIFINQKLRNSNEQMLDTLLHEIQHVIQWYEGFALGSSPDWWMERLPYKSSQTTISEILNNDDAYQELRAYRDEMVEILHEALGYDTRRRTALALRDATEEGQDYLAAKEEEIHNIPNPTHFKQLAEDAIKAGLFREFKAAIANEIDLKNREKWAAGKATSLRGQKAFDLYKNTKGEIEARDVSNRRTLTAEQRRQLPPDIHNPNAVDVDNYDPSVLKYQLKSAEELSDRYYLSSALESATVNENEKNILKEYQAKVDQADALQEQLDNLNAEIHKYMFQKGRDTDKLAAMRNNAKTLGDKLDRIDKSLLKLERMSVLKDLATREKNKAVAKERARQKQFQSEMRENYRVKDYKRKIQKVVKDLNKLLNGGKDRNIKIPLQPTARNAIALAEQMFASTNRLDILYNLEGEGLEDYKALYDEYEALESKVTDEGRAMRSRLIETSHEFDSMIDSEVERLNEVRSMSVRTAVSELANAYRSLQENENEYAKQAWDAGVQEYLNDLVTNMADVSVDKLTPAQFESIYKAFRMVYHTISISNKLFKASRSVSDLSRSVIDQVGEGRDFKAKVTQGRFDALNWVRSYSWSNLKPIYAFERIGSDDLTSLFWNVRSGEDVWAKDIQEAKLEAEMIREKYGWKNWDMNQRFDVKLQNGRVFPTTLGHLLSIVGYARREQALAHMSVGGFTYRESDLAKVGEWRNNKEGAQIGEEDLKTIANLLTNEQIQYAYEMQDYLSKMGAKGNEVSRQLYGIDLFGEDYYLPIKSSRESLSGQDTERNEAPSVASLKNKGFTKNVTPNARNKMELVQLDELWASHVNEMALYHGMVLPLTDLNRVLDFKESGSEEQGELSVKSAINQKFGSAATEYLAGFIRDVNGGVTTDRTANLFTKGLTKFKKTATMMSLSVVAQQYTAVARATALINPKYFAGKTDGMSHKQAYDELMQYAPIAFIKQLGGFDTGSGRTATEYLMDGSGQTKRQKVMSKIDEVGGIGAQYMDEVGWNTIWNAVKREVRETTDLTGEEFLKKCGERFTEVIVYTQVYDSTLARSALMRSKNAYVQMLTAFMGEPTTSINMLYNAILQRARGKWTSGQTARTIGATYTSIILAAAAASLVYAMRYDDDDEKSYAEIYGEKFGAKLRDELMPWNSLPFIRDIASLIEGWDVNREDVSVYGDLINDARRLFTEPTSEKALEFAGSFGNLFGIPASNIIRDTTALWNLVERSATTSNHDLLEGFARGWSGEKETKSERLFDVMQDKDQQGLDLIREEYASDKTFEQAQRDALRTNLVEVRTAAYKTVIGSSWLGEIDKAVSRGFDRNLVVAAVEAEARYIADQAKKAAEAFEEDKDKYKEIVSNFKKRYKDVFGSESKAQDFIISHMNRFRG